MRVLSHWPFVPSRWSTAGCSIDSHVCMIIKPYSSANTACVTPSAVIAQRQRCRLFIWGCLWTVFPRYYFLVNVFFCGQIKRIAIRPQLTSLINISIRVVYAHTLIYHFCYVLQLTLRSRFSFKLYVYRTV